jgi:hypothetical protein
VTTAATTASSHQGETELAPAAGLGSLCGVVAPAVDAAVGFCAAGDSGTDAIDEDSRDGDDSVGGGDGFDCVGDGLGDGFGDGALDVGVLEGWPPPVCVGVVAVTAGPGRVVAEEGAGDRVRVGVGATGSREGDSEGDREADSVGEREADNDGGLIDPSPAWPPPLPPHADRRPSTRAPPAADWRTRLSIGHLPISGHSIRTAHCVCETSRVTSPAAGDSADSTVARRSRRHRRHHAMSVRRPRRGSLLGTAQRWRNSASASAILSVSTAPTSSTTTWGC